MTIRYLTPLPANPSKSQLWDLTKQMLPTAIDLNVVDVNGVDNLAVYLNDGDAANPQPWKNAIASWIPIHPTPEETIQANQVDDNNLAQAISDQIPQAWITKAKAILQDPNNRDANHTPTPQQVAVGWAINILDARRRFR